MINIIGTIYDNSSLHTVALANQILDEDYQDGKKQSEINRNLDQRITSIERNGSGQGGDGTRHIILTQSEYNELSEYTDDAIYFIVEPESNTWTFGDGFPITFGTTFIFG